MELNDRLSLERPTSEHGAAHPSESPLGYLSGPVRRDSLACPGPPGALTAGPGPGRALKRHLTRV